MTIFTRSLKALCISASLSECTSTRCMPGSADNGPSSVAIPCSSVSTSFDSILNHQGTDSHGLQSAAELEAFRKEHIQKQRLRFEQQVHQTNPNLWNAPRFKDQLRPGESIWERPEVMKELHAEFKRQTVLKHLQQVQEHRPLLWRAYTKQLQHKEPVWARLKLLETTKEEPEFVRELQRWELPFIVQRYFDKPVPG